MNESAADETLALETVFGASTHFALARETLSADHEAAAESDEGH